MEAVIRSGLLSNPSVIIRVLVSGVFAFLCSATQATITGLPSPNTGVYTVSWSEIPNSSEGYKLFESIDDRENWFCGYQHWVATGCKYDC